MIPHLRSENIKSTHPIPCNIRSNLHSDDPSPPTSPSPPTHQRGSRSTKSLRFRNSFPSTQAQGFSLSNLTRRVTFSSPEPYILSVTSLVKRVVLGTRMGTGQGSRFRLLNRRIVVSKNEIARPTLTGISSSTRHLHRFEVPNLRQNHGLVCFIINPHCACLHIRLRGNLRKLN